VITKRITSASWGDKTQCLSAWAEELNKPVDTLDHRLRAGWCLEGAFNKPIRTKARRVA
jgi:hypothetical protein